MRHVALLYSVILTPERRIKSAELVEVANRAGLLALRTVLSTGNLVIESGLSEAAIEAALERSIVAQFGKAVPVFVRAAANWLALAGDNPFPDESLRNPACVAVRVMRRQPAPVVVDRISAFAQPGHRFAVRDRALWIASVDQLSTSPLFRAVGAAWAGEGTMRSASALAKISNALND